MKNKSFKIILFLFIIIVVIIMVFLFEYKYINTGPLVYENQIEYLKTKLNIEKKDITVNKVFTFDSETSINCVKMGSLVKEKMKNLVFDHPTCRYEYNEVLFNDIENKIYRLEWSNSTDTYGNTVNEIDLNFVYKGKKFSSNEEIISYFKNDSTVEEIDKIEYLDDTFKVIINYDNNSIKYIELCEKSRT